MGAVLFKGQDFRVNLDTGIDLAGATELKIYYKTPTGDKNFWDVLGNIDGTKLFHDVTAAENKDAGFWTFQTYIKAADGREYWGDIATKVISDNIK